MGELYPSEGVHVLPDHGLETSILGGDGAPFGSGDLLVHVEGVVGELPAAKGGELPLARGRLHLLAGPEEGGGDQGDAESYTRNFSFPGLAGQEEDEDGDKGVINGIVPHGETSQQQDGVDGGEPAPGSIDEPYQGGHPQQAEADKEGVGGDIVGYIKGYGVKDKEDQQEGFDAAARFEPEEQAEGKKQGATLQEEVLQTDYGLVGVGEDADQPQKFRIGHGPHIDVGVAGRRFQVGVAVGHVVREWIPEFEDDELKNEGGETDQPPSAVGTVVP